ncbi:MAG: PAS domain S-box protein [Euryarchaeota archaeon]|nr:PAS domain S-box protein [Euryarchaeota archaeon]
MFCLIVSAAVLMPMSVCQAQEDTVRIGVQSNLPDYMTLQQWEMTAEYLAQEIPGYSFEIIQLSYDEMLVAADNGDVDFVACNPMLEVELESQYGVSAIATRMNKCRGELYQIVGIAIITRADRNDINDLSDLKGRSFAAPPEKSFAWRIVQRELMSEGIDPYTVEPELGYPNHAVVDAVINGDVDAGGVRVGTLEQMVLDGTLDIDDIKGIHIYHRNMDDGESDTCFYIIGGQVVKSVHFIHSTRLYPEWAFSRLPYTNVNLAGHVAEALHTMPVSSAMAAQGDRYAGWGAPLNYQPVHECLRDLQISPYEDYGEFSLIDAVSKYGYIPLTLISIILLSIMYSHRLTSMNHELKSEISSRKQTENELREQDNRLRSIFRTTPTGIGVVSERVIIQVNEKLCEITGYSKDELRGQSARMLYPSDRGYEFVGKERYAQFKKSGTGTVETRWKRKGGEIIDIILSSSTIDPDDLSQGDIFSVLDISKRKQAEETLRKSEEQLNLAIEGSRMGIWDWMVQTGEKTFNDRWAEILGYTLDELKSISIKTWEQLVHSDDLERSYYLFNEHFEGRTDNYECELRMRHKDGDWVWVHDKGKVVEWDSEGYPIRMIGTHIDITERKQAEETLKKYADDLEHSNEMKDIFTDIMRHDLLSPTNIINGFIGLLLETETDGSKRHQLENIKVSNERLIEMIRNASEFSKLDATENIQLETADIGSLIEKAASNLKHESTTKKMDIELPSGGPYSARVNSMIEDVFVNLLSNAIKYSPAGSRVAVDVLDADDMWKVTVTDAGEGVSDEDKSLVFERFKRVHKKNIKGSGLGLAIVKRIIDLHGGDVGVEDNPQGQGSVFWVSVKKA